MPPRVRSAATTSLMPDNGTIMGCLDKDEVSNPPAGLWSFAFAIARKRVLRLLTALPCNIRKGLPISRRAYRFSLCGLLAFALTVCFRGVVLAQEIQPSAVSQIQSILEEKMSRTPAQQKMDSHLHLSGQAARGTMMVAEKPWLANVSKLLEFDELQRVHVDIWASVNDELLAEIVALGGVVESSFPEYAAIRAWIPLLDAETLAERSERHVHQASRPGDPRHAVG